MLQNSYMNKIGLLVLFFVITYHSIGQSSYVEYYTVKPKYPPNYEMKIIQQMSCHHCPEGAPPLDSNSLKENQKAEEFSKQVGKLKSIKIKYDSLHGFYLTQNSILNTFRTEYYSSFVKDLKGNPFSGPNQNSSSPEYKTYVGDSAVGTIRYRVVCKDCPYPKRRNLYYIFFYNKEGVILRHGLAKLKRARK